MSEGEYLLVTGDVNVIEIILGIKVKVYFWDCIDSCSMLFQSKEFGWMEYLEGEYFCCHANKTKMIGDLYNHHKNPQEAFRKYSQLTYLGEL